MVAQARFDWARANQRGLMHEVGIVRRALERHVGRELEPGAGDVAAEPASALDNLCNVFALSSFERKILVIVSGHQAPALTVASLATITAGRPSIFPSPVTTPASGACPS